jgi:hypothetical protein
MRLILFPNLMAATVSIDGLPFPMTFDEFREVDEDAVNKWADVVYELNPHWLASSNQDESKKKSSRKR